MESHKLSYRDSSIHYLKFGRGTRFLVCFHGYGEDASSFAFLEKHLGQDYTIIALDLPFHGQTQWNEGPELQPGQLLEVLSAILPLELQRISLAGYSMGGRIALALLQERPAAIDRVVLVAPDGLHRNFWYWLSTRTSTGNRLFAYTMKHPHWFFSGMKVLRSVGLLNKSIFRFAHSYLDNFKEREMLYLRWTGLRQFRPSLAKLRRILQEHPVAVRMLFGAYDRIILDTHAKGIAKNGSVKIKTIRAGHQLLKPKYGREIAALFVE